MLLHPGAGPFHWDKSIVDYVNFNLMKIYPHTGKITQYLKITNGQDISNYGALCNVNHYCKPLK